MSKGIIQTIVGIAEIAVGIALEFVPGGQWFGAMLIAAGAGMLFSGIGTLLAGQNGGVSLATRNPVKNWDVVYGQGSIGGTIVFLGEFGDHNKYLDMVIVLAAHASQSVDRLMFDDQWIIIGDNNTSYTPPQQDIDIANISRLNNVITVVLNTDIAGLQDGDQVIIHDVSADQTMNGRVPVFDVLHDTPSGITFRYLSGGGPGSYISGKCKTAWADYGRKVYMETMLGDQVLGQTFAGMVNGTPDDGDAGNLIQNDNNPWTSDCSLVGKTAVHLRLHYDQAIFPNGIPQIKFLMRGKKDIYDPRTGLYSYSDNAALCIADYLANSTFGFRAAYGTEIPIDSLIAAANICDEQVQLAIGGTESRYTCNGTFDLSVRRGEVLQNLLTSCAGRIVYVGGQFRIFPGSFAGVSATLDKNWIPSNASGGFRWRPTVSVRDLYNGVKGTYVSPANKWNASDFPGYAQDGTHGYNNGPADMNYDANRAADGGDRRWFDIQLPFTNSSSTAQRIAKIELLRRRHQGTGTFALNMAGYPFVPMDVLAVSLDIFGWSGQYLEVLAARFKLDNQDAGGTQTVLLGVEIDVQETDPSIYAWDIGEDLSPQGYVQAIVPDNRTPAPPTNFKATPSQGIIVLTWDPPVDAFVTNGGSLELRYQLVASPPGIYVSLGHANPSTTRLDVPGLTPLDTYLFQIRSVNVAGVPSEWVSATAVYPEPAAQVWMPNYLQPPDGDPIYPVSDFKFAMNQQGSSSSPSVQVTGENPVTAPSYATSPVINHVAVNGAGGSLKANRTYYFGLTVSRNGSPSALSIVEKVLLPGGNDTQEVVLDQLIWPPGIWDKWILYGSIDRQEMLCEQKTGDGSSLPSSIIIDDLPNFATYGPPNVSIDHIRLKIKQSFHPGVIASLVTEVRAATGTGPMAAGSIRCMHLAADETQDTDPFEGGINWRAGVDTGRLATDDWTGRRVSVITKKADGSAPIADFKCTGYDATSGKFYLTPDPSEFGIGVGDVFVVRFIPQWSNDGTSFRDDQMVNGEFSAGTSFDFPPNTAVVPAMFGRTIAGPGRGQLIPVAAHDDTSYSFVEPFVDVDDTTVIIIERAPWLIVSDENKIAIPAYGNIGRGVAPLNGLLEYGYIVEGVLVDQDGSESPDELSPVREFYLFTDVSYGGASGPLEQIARFEFGRGSDGGPAAVGAGDISAIMEVDAGCTLQGWSVVNEGNPVGASTFDILRYDSGGDTYVSILSPTVITIPDAAHDEVFFSSAFGLGTNLQLNAGDLLKCVCLSVGGTAPLSPVVRLFAGLPLPTPLGSGGVS